MFLVIYMLTRMSTTIIFLMFCSNDTKIIAPNFSLEITQFSLFDRQSAEMFQKISSRSPSVTF